MRAVKKKLLTVRMTRITASITLRLLVVRNFLRTMLTRVLALMNNEPVSPPKIPMIAEAKRVST